MSEVATPGRAPVRVVHAADPAEEASRLADELGADVVVDVAAAEQAVRERVEAGRRALGAPLEEDRQLLERAEAIRSLAAAPPPIDDDDVAELRRLADDLGRAARIRARTETRVAEILQVRVAASSGVAIHPESVAGAAKAVVDAEAAVEKVLQEIDLLGPQPAWDDPVGDTDLDPVLRRPHDDFDEADLERRRATLRAAGLALVILAVAFVGVAAGAPDALVPLALVVAVGVAVVTVVQGRQAATRVDEMESNLLAVSAAVDATEGARKLATIDAREAWMARRVALDATRDAAQEQLRVARNRWHQLAGPGADPHEPERSVRAHDPQLTYDGRVAEASPTIRTVAAFHRRAQARWRVMWARLGRAEPDDPARLEEILDEVLALHRRAQDELRDLEEAEAREAARAAARRPLVLVEPHTWLAASRVTQLVAGVPAESEVVVVEREGGVGER